MRRPIQYYENLGHNTKNEGHVVDAYKNVQTCYLAVIHLKIACFYILICINYISM